MAAVIRHIAAGHQRGPTIVRSMGIGHYIREIGRGRQGARALSREQAADLMQQVLDGRVTDLEVGGFCLAMRIKGETPDELAGFLDAVQARLAQRPASDRPVVVLPSYNGARRMPVLTPLLALLLAREGCPVLIHGHPTEDARVFVPDVLADLGIYGSSAIEKIAPGAVVYCDTAVLCPPLARLLAVRRVVGLRNPAHSVVKLMNPCAGAAVIVGSHTHAEYADSMAGAFERTGATAMLLRGTEGEPVADARRMPRIDGFVRGQRRLLEPGVSGPRVAPPGLPETVDVAVTAGYIRAVLAGRLPVPAPIARQVEQLLQLVQA